MVRVAEKLSAGCFDQVATTGMTEQLNSTADPEPRGV